MRIRKSIVQSIVIILVTFTSCKKDFNNDLGKNLITTKVNVSVIKNDNFPNGVLKFSNKESLNSYLEDIKEFKKNSISEFKSFKNELDSFRNVQNIIAASSNRRKSNSMDIEDVNAVEQMEYIYDLNQYALPSEEFQYIVNSDLQVMVGENLYQFTRLGMFEVTQGSYNNYQDAVIDNLDVINTNPNYTSIPSEVSIGNNTYFVSDGIIRYASVGDDILTQENNIENVSNTSSPVLIQNQNNVETHSIKSDLGVMMGKHFSIYLQDFAKRRLIFGVKNIKINTPFFGFNQVSIGSKVQREKTFLGIKYWGPSYADELIVGCDNMSVEAEAVFPYPDNFSYFNKPKVEEILSDYKLGGKIISLIGLTVNVNVLNYTLNQTHIANFIDSKFNEVVDNEYKNIFKSIESNFLNAIDPTYINRFANHTKRVTFLNSQHKLNWIYGEVENAVGYAHSHTWVLDHNVGVSYKVNGGAGGTNLSYYYPYKIKKGSFYGKARFGNTWKKIRIIID